MSDFTTEASDIDLEVDDTDVDVDLPGDGPDGESDQPEQGDLAEPDPDEPTFTVKVDGEEIEVRQSELLAGYQRQADYTRKTQALADQRKDLADAQALLSALQRNPHQTLAVLAQAYGVAPTGGGDEGDTEFLTEEEQRIKNLEAWQRAELDRQREAQIDSTITNLHATYGDFNDDELFAFAVARNVMDLETALRSMLYERVVAANAKQANAKRTEKRSAGAAANGGSRTGTPLADDVEINTVEDAWAYAKRLLNAT